MDIKYVYVEDANIVHAQTTAQTPTVIRLKIDSTNEIVTLRNHRVLGIVDGHVVLKHHHQIVWKNLVVAELPNDVPEVDATLSDTRNLFFVYGKKNRW